MEVFEEFLKTIEVATLSNSIELKRSIAEEPLLNGYPYKVFRDSVDIDFRRSKGTFFSGPKIGNVLDGFIRAGERWFTGLFDSEIQQPLTSSDDGCTRVFPLH